MEPPIRRHLDAIGWLRGRQRRSERPVSRGPVVSGPFGVSLGEHLLVGDRWEHLAGAVAALVVVGVDERGDVPAGPVLGGELPSREELPLEGRVEAFAAALSSADPTRPIDWTAPSAVQASVNTSPTYSPPLSEWNTTPVTWPPRTAAAMHSAALASGASWCSPIANPGSRRDARSKTVARYSLPSSVGISVRSPHQRWLITPAAKSLFTRSGIGAAALSGRVSQRRFRFGQRPARPWRTIEAATDFFDTRHPVSTKTSNTEVYPQSPGDPLVP